MLSFPRVRFFLLSLCQHAACTDFSCLSIAARFAVDTLRARLQPPPPTLLAGSPPTAARVEAAGGGLFGIFANFLPAVFAACRRRRYYRQRIFRVFSALNKPGQPAASQSITDASFII